MVGLAGAAWSTTTNIAADQLVISTEVSWAGFADILGAGSGDDTFEGWWVLLLDDVDGSTSVNSGKERMIVGYDASASELTVAGANLSVEDEASYFEIHRYRPTLLREMLNTARRLAFNRLYLPVTRTLYTGYNQVRYEVPSAIIGRPDHIWVDTAIASDIGDNILANAGFETFAASAFTSWTATTLDIDQETTTTTPQNYAVFRDQSAARCTSQTTSVGTLLQSISSPGTHSGQRITLSIWVYCLTASVVSTRITVNGTVTLGTLGDGGLHTGTG